jgi:hypothetical protein
VAISPLAFTGVSSFSNDFQAILNRAVAIAQLPIKALQNHQSDLLQEKQLATSLEGAVSNLPPALPTSAPLEPVRAW